MFRGRTVVSKGLAVWLFSPGANTDLDWAAYCDAIRTTARETAEHPHPCAVQIIEAGSEDPNAKWRRGIAQALRDVTPRSQVILVTASKMVRHGLTAIFWLVPPKFAVEVVGSEESGLERLELLHPGRRPDAEALLAELRAQISRDVS